MEYTQYADPHLSNTELNAPGSTYATNYAHAKSLLIRDEITKMIHDNTPKNFYLDMKVLLMKVPLIKAGDEFTYFEQGIQVKAISSILLTADIAAGFQQTVPIANPTEVAAGVVLGHPVGNQQVLVVDVNVSASTMTIQAMTGETLPLLSNANTYVFSNKGGIDGDPGGTSVGYRLTNLIQRYNYIEQFIKHTTFERTEMRKYQMLGTTDYVEMNMKNLLNIFLQDKSVKYWNGVRGEGDLNGRKVKFMNGIYPTAINGGAAPFTTSAANLLDTLAIACTQTLVEEDGGLKFFYATPENIYNLSKGTKLGIIRFNATNDNNLDITLDTIDFGFTKVALIRKQDWMFSSGRYPKFFEKTGILLNQDDITPVMMWPDSFNTIGGRQDGVPTLRTDNLKYWEGTLSQQWSNPAAAAIITIN